MRCHIFQAVKTHKVFHYMKLLRAQHVMNWFFDFHSLSLLTQGPTPECSSMIRPPDI